MQLHLKINDKETIVDLGNVIMPQNGLQELAQSAARFATTNWEQCEAPAVNVVSRHNADTGKPVKSAYVAPKNVHPIRTAADELDS